jgi:hypothetical protein
MDRNPTAGSIEPGFSVGSAGLAVESAVSAISWPAIFAGGIAAAAASVVLVLLGSGVGLTTISPWPPQSATTTTFTIAAGIWLIVVQWLSSGLGGFLTGRLRTRWMRVHTHEVFFRDTAHGLLTWGLATVIGALLALSAVSSITGTATRAAATLASGAVQVAGQTGAGRASAGVPASSLAQSQAYEVDTLFRGEKPELAPSDSAVRAETTRIFMAGALNGGIPDADRAYLVDTVAARTGLSSDDARKRVDDAIAQEKTAEVRVREAADTARKSAAAAAIFAALSMLIGAFIACAAAAYGGSLRDAHP